MDCDDGFHGDRTVDVREFLVSSVKILDHHRRGQERGIDLEHDQFGPSGEVQCKRPGDLVPKRAVDESFGAQTRGPVGVVCPQ